jgi:tripartite-type tricarboxylate transporter receptor subunit TctC
MKKGILMFVLSLAITAGIGFSIPYPTLAAYPEKPVAMICVFPAGGAMDMTARALAEA